MQHAAVGTALRRVLPAAASYFGIAFGAGFVFGALRVTLLVPRLGMRMAELLEMPLMAVVIVFAARWALGRFALHGRPRQALAMGGAALALLLAAELLLAVLLADRTLAAYIASRDPVSGSVYAVMLLFFALLPAGLARRCAGRPRAPTGRHGDDGAKKQAP